MNIKNTIIELFDLEKMGPEKAGEMVDRLGKLIIQTSLARVLPNFSDEEMDEYDALIDGEGGWPAAYEYILKKEPKFNDILEEEAEILRANLAGEFEESGLQ